MRRNDREGVRYGVGGGRSGVWVFTVADGPCDGLSSCHPERSRRVWVVGGRRCGWRGGRFFGCAQNDKKGAQNDRDAARRNDGGGLPYRASLRARGRLLGLAGGGSRVHAGSAVVMMARLRVSRVLAQAVCGDGPARCSGFWRRRMR